ncbi:hypothetical protein F4678DRAFT_345021 [Xylaria arbuscula]|nr:hypothetical protein F4678DRAFT_345021 [Xylaria arbuscula]
MEDFIDTPSGASIFDDNSNHVAEDAAPNGVGYALPPDTEGHELSWPSLEIDAKDESTPEKPLDIAVSKSNEEDPELGSGNIQDPLEDTETRTNGQDSNYSGPEDSIITSGLSQSLRTIEVVLRPPPDPEAYDRIPPSRTVLRVVEADDESDDETFYTVEFKDGRIEHVSAESNETGSVAYEYRNSTYEDVCGGDYRSGF